jgi:hypothetical protein
MAYLWLTDDEINPFLNSETIIGTQGEIDSGDATYLTTKAQTWENLVIRTMVDHLSSVYEITVGHSDDEYLKLLAAQWTAAVIASGHMGTSVGLPDWTDRFKNEVLSALSRKIRSQSNIASVAKRDVPLHNRILFAKTMEQTVVSE